jgi:Rod binding domain-containing protein
MPEPILNTVSPLAADRSERRHALANAPQPVAGPAADAKLKSVCEDMEALFIHHMLSEMRKTVAKSGLIDGGRSEEIYTSLMDAELAKEMAHRGALGLSSMLREQLDLRGAASQGPIAPKK